MRILGLQGGNVTSAGWQVTLCYPMWHVSSRSGVATLRTAVHLLLSALEVFLNDMRYINPRFAYLLTYLLTHRSGNFFSFRHAHSR